MQDKYLKEKSLAEYNENAYLALKKDFDIFSDELESNAEIYQKNNAILQEYN